ncbi:DUF1128 domain-containing protein [Paenibacillus aurantius]|uniref:UPF0435 protein MJA45_22565 n=1 Tax=Paenibacillus aurantius TaxID=2918900 RepID=A0AA96REN4_9BACL|nr:DUF1128 domain-containing protein [Paenibacillus aurantius]WJH35117.1 DUF1128 domain-containing protein [Paenibacillus sp. CC-CFT747]WNQ10378.1 DUF1128 domain-containing protein [Paenibacillus aurantius]
MDLSVKSLENVDYMIEAIKTKLRVASGAAIKAEHFDYEKYEDLLDIYEHVQSKNQFSVSEMDALVVELGRLRKG